MKQENLIIRQKYNSYKSKITPVIDTDFHAAKPKQKWLTNITEFCMR